MAAAVSAVACGASYKSLALPAQRRLRPSVNVLTFFFFFFARGRTAGARR